MTRSRSGATLVEVLVVMALIGVLIAILIPAVQYARESARKNTCRNNLRQIVLGLQNHESARGELPPLQFGTFLKQPGWAPDEFYFHSWRTAILPQLDQDPLYHRIDLSLAATDPANQANVNTKIPVFVCPSTSSPNEIVPGIYAYNNGQLPTVTVGTAARSDYEAVGGVSFVPKGLGAGTWDLHYIRFGAWGEPLAYPKTRSGISYRKARFKDVSDGLSQTILVGERAGRPDLYRKGKPVDDFPYDDPQQGMDHHQAAWGISTHFWWLVSTHKQAINETNASGLFSFHSSGANVGLADGSVRFLSVSIHQDTLNALSTRSGGDTAALD